MAEGTMKRQAPALFTGIAVLLVAALAAVAFGTESIDLRRALTDPTSLDRIIALHVRLPRVALAAVAGGGLAMTGVAFQALLRNPLAEPYVLGVSGGAALGATLVILTGVTSVSIFGASAVSLGAFAGGLGATALAYILTRAGSASTSRQDARVLLAGVVVNAIASAAITFLKTMVSASKAQELLLWLMGFLDVPSLASLAAVTTLVALGAVVLLADAGRYNLLALGDEAASHLGVDVKRLERRAFFACSLIVGAVVSVTGLIAFVGLIVPHALRRIFGPDVRVLIPASIFAGAGTLIACDLVARLFFHWLHTEPPVGAVTALVGGPLFLLLLARGANRA